MEHLFCWPGEMAGDKNAACPAAQELAVQGARSGGDGIGFLEVADWPGGWSQEAVMFCLPEQCLFILLNEEPTYTHRGISVNNLMSGIS